MFNDLLRMRSCYSVALYNVCLITKLILLCCVIANLLFFISDLLSCIFCILVFMSLLYFVEKHNFITSQPRPSVEW